MTTSFRNKQTGQYAISKMDRLCRCGHVLGVHLAEGKRECIKHEAEGGEECGCAGFKEAKK